MNKTRHLRSVMMSAITICLFALSASCGGGGDSGSDPGESGSITLTVSATTIPADGSSSATITAIVRDTAGKPVRHFTDVTFSTTLGHFRNGSTTYKVQTQPPIVDGRPDIRADPTGKAEVALIAGYTAGSAKVTVESNNVTQTVYVSFTGAGAAIRLEASPASIPADGTSSSTIKATLTDSTGAPVKPGTSVIFTTGLGHLSGGGKSYKVFTSDNTGTVVVSLIAGIVPGTTYVVATSNNVSQAISIVFTDTYASHISIKASPQYIAADGVSTSLVTATIKDVADNGIREVPVTFYDANVPTEPTPLPEGNIWKGTGRNDHVTPDFYSYSGSTTFTMTYSGSETSGFAVRLWNRDKMKVDSLLINTTGPVTDEKVSKALGAGNYYFQVDADGEWEIKIEGSIGPAQVGKPKVLAVTHTDSSGNAEYLYTSTLTPGVMKIRAETGQASVIESEEALNATVEITQTEGPPPRVAVTAVDSLIYANGVDSTTIQAIVLNADGNPAPNGTVVTFSVTSGAINPLTATTIDGIVSTTLTSVSSPTSVTAIVTATAGADSGSTKVYFVGVSLTDMRAKPTAIFANGTDTAKITARLRDEFGAAVEGEGIAFVISAGGGTLNPWYATTDAEGIATVDIIAPTTPGTATVTAGFGLLTTDTSVTFTSFPTVGSITLTADPAKIPADGSTSTILTASLKDTAGAPVPKGTSVAFNTTLGSFPGGNRTFTTITPDATGTVSVPLMSSTTVGSALVIATAGGVTQSIYVGFGGNSVVMVLTANPTSIWADGVSSSAIQATLTDGTGAPVTQGTSVTFYTTLGGFNNLHPLYTVTTPDATGVVTVSLIAGITPGRATVSATSNGVTQSVYVDFIEKGGDPFSMTLKADPVNIPADGSSSSTITATLKDSSGNPVKTGTPVTFSTTLGTFSNDAKTYAVTTPDTTGIVSVSLISVTTAGSAAVTATSDGVTETVYVTFGGGTATIGLKADPTAIPADGTSSSIITATLKDGSGAPVTPGTPVTFTTGLGTFSNGLTTLTVQTPDATGIVSVSLIAGTTPGDALVTVTSNGVSQTITVEFTGTPEVAKIEVAADPSDIPADGASTSTITATVKTATNQVIPDVEVTFATTRGAITSPHTTDQKGEAAAQLRSDRYNDNNVIVTASCQGIEGTATVSFTGVELTVKADPSNLLAGESSTITATLKDAAGNPIRGATLTFITDKGTLDHTTRTTDAAGQAAVKLTSIDSGIATVTVSGRGADAETEVHFTRYLFTLEADPTTIRVGETSQITATLLDNGVPRAGETVDFSTSLGTLAPYSDTTDGNGEATTVLTAGTQAGTATIDANVTIATDTPPTELSASTPVVITGGDAAKIVLTADPASIDVNTGVSTITATVYDVNDQPSPNQDIYFRINLGPGGGEILSASVATTNTSGIATVQFYAGSLASAYEGVEIEANTQPDFSGSLGLVRLTIAGPVANIGIGMNLETLTPDGGNLKIDISAIATDVSGNPVADGTKINFSVEAIEFDEDRANDHTIDCWDINKNPIIPCPPVGTPGFGVTWFSDDVNQDGTMYSIGGPMSTTEDVNHNGVLDPGEDKNDNGVIDPIQGTVIDTSVDTTGGVAPATLIYPAPQANNIRVRITAEAGGVSNFYETILLCTQKMVDQGTCGIGY